MNEGENQNTSRDIKTLLKEIFFFLKDYFKNPIVGIRQIPHWKWHEILLVQCAITGICGMLSGLVAKSVSRFFLGLLFFPFTSIMSHFVVAGFFYYTFLFFYKTSVDFRKLYFVSFLAQLPFIVMMILSPLFRPISLIGLAVTGILLLIGFSENFDIPKKSLSRFFLILYLAYLIVWVATSFNLTKKENTFRKMATPENLDILEKELKEK